ncbi:cation transporter, partial [Shimia sp.]|uniref:cation transporter n=1 Tax=Shimia sp. TaxID=1954381 RepID=UPI003566CCEC
MTEKTAIGLQVTGMSCASCVGRVERVLRAQPGIEEAAVNLADESARVVHDGTVSAADLVAVLDDAGYPAVTEELVLEV